MKGSHLEYLEKCPVCRAPDFSPYLRSNDHQIVKCRSCQILFVNPRPSESYIKGLFSEEYIDNDKRVEEDFTSWRQASLKREARRLQQILPSGGRLLDIGTASGAFLGEFKDAPHWRVEGLEPSRFAAKRATARYGVPVHPGFLHDQQFPAESFDVVTSLDALCFHPNPRRDMEEIARILKPSGLLAIEIPGLRFRMLKNTGPVCRLLYGEEARLNAGVHLFYYSRRTLGFLVGQFGFRQIAAFPEQSPLYGPWYLKMANHLFYLITGGLYRLTRGGVNLAPKEFIVYRKESA